ncbi:MAG TPA: glycosyltransferase family 9 protein [Candidatus Baltobacteraceae bacterium]
MSSALLVTAGGGIGDSLLATVVAQALRQRFDRIDALALPGHRAALERVPDLDAVLLDAGEDPRALAAQLGARNYDASVVTWATARTARLPALANIPIRVGQARRLYSGRFTKRVFVRSELGDVTSPWSDILLDYARALGCDAPGAVPHFVPTAADRDAADVLIAGLGGAFLIMHPTNAIAPQRGIWPTQAWSALARALADRYDATVVVSGTQADAAIVDDIVRGASTPNRPPRVVSIAGALEIGGFGALAARAKAFVGITTGAMHVAAAVGCPTVGIFPFQSDFPERWAPRGPRTAIVRASYPCHRNDTKENCPDYACIANLNIPRIMTVTNDLLS